MNNSVIGFPVASDSSVMKLYYHQNEDDTVSASYNFILNGAVNFNQIISDKTGTVLEPIENQYYEEFFPVDDRLYLQAGSGLVLKMDMQPLLDFTDTIPNLIINSAAIEIQVVNPAYNILTSQYIHFYYTDSLNRRITMNNIYQGVLAEGTSDILALEYDSEDLIGYRGTVTSYSEDLIRDINKYTQLLVYPSEFDLTQAVNQMIVLPDNIRLKMYYTALKNPDVD